MKFKYVGQKTDGERAFQDKSGIEWFPGDCKEVESREAVALMLQHPTVWEPAEAVSLGDAKPPAPALVNVGHLSDEDVLDDAEQREKAARQAAAASNSSDPLAGLDDGQVRAFAKEQGLKINAIALTKGDKLRAKVREALAKK